MARIGFLGLGNMGIGMARRLIAGGHEVRAWNRTRARADQLAPDGAVVASTPAAAATGSEVVFAMLADDTASTSAWTGAGGALAAMRPDALAIECSTLSADWVSTLSTAARDRGLRYLDCPVTGLPEVAAAGRLTLLVGADAPDLEAARPYLEWVSERIIHFGPVGAGTAYKLIVNLMGAVQIAGAAEGMAMAAAAGLDLAQVAEALSLGQAASPQVSRTARLIATDSHARDVIFASRLRLKDTAYGVRLARQLGLDAPFGTVAEGLYRKMVDDGLGELNDSGVVRLLGRREGCGTP